MRLLLADIAAKEAQLETLRQQYRDQRTKVIGYTLYSETSLETSLGLMRDIGERLRETESTLEHLALVRRKAESELESLQLTRGVEQAKAELAALQLHQGDNGDASTRSAVADEIRRLQNLINEASERAARTIESR
jgi:hypothetical protein